MRGFLLIIVLMLAGLHGAAARQAMHCKEAKTIVATQMPVHRGCCPPLHCAIDCPMHGGALIRLVPVPVSSVCVARASFGEAPLPAALGWLTAPAHGPPRAVG